MPARSTARSHARKPPPATLVLFVRHGQTATTGTTLPGRAPGLHLADSGRKQDQQDKHFQGFGRFTTGASGEYYFRTIKPVPYPGRTPHIHFKIKQGEKELLTTQCYVKDDPGNDKDGIYESEKVITDKVRNCQGLWFDGPMRDTTISDTIVVDQIADALNFHIGVTNSIVRNNFIRNTGDDGLAMWSEKTANAGNVFDRNTRKDAW